MRKTKPCEVFLGYADDETFIFSWEPLPELPVTTGISCPVKDVWNLDGGRKMLYIEIIIPQSTETISTSHAAKVGAKPWKFINIYPLVD